MDDINKSIDTFLNQYLAKFETLVHGNEVVVEKCPDIELPNIDFFFIFSFVDREFSHLKSLDYSVVSYDVKKAYSYAKLSKTKYIEFTNNLLSAKIVFLNKFTIFHPAFNEIKKSLEKSTKIKHSNMIRADIVRETMSQLLKVDEEDFDETEYKANKKILANSLTRMDQARNDIDMYVKEEEELKEKYFSLFVDKYNERNDNIIESLERQMGFFIFYVNSLLWDNVFYSFKIKEFFDFIKVENASLSTYMAHHLKHQTSLNHKEKNLIEFRKKLIQSIIVIKEYENKDKNDMLLVQEPTG